MSARIPLQASDDRKIPLVTSRRPLLYLGGPVDFAKGPHEASWQHWDAWNTFGKPYCPKCECVGLKDDQIIAKNRVNLIAASICILDLRGRSIGTPIEMYWRVWEADLPTILIVEPGSVFVRYTTDNYLATTVPTPEEALALVRSLW